MRRAILTIGGTVAGVAALLSFKTHPAADAAAATTGPPGSTSSPGATPGGGTKSAATRTVTGTAADTPYGPMQVQLVLTGQQITKVNVLQHTDDGTNSAQIDSFALPKLTSETLAAQSARVDAVSGATYTSQGYIKSLQSAVDTAGLS